MITSAGDLIANLADAKVGNAMLDFKIARVLKGRGTDYRQWTMAHNYVDWLDGGHEDMTGTPRYTTSLDAALLLVPEGEPWNIGRETSNDHGIAWVGGNGKTITAATAVLALCIAALKTWEHSNGR